MNKQQIHYCITNQNLDAQINNIISCFDFEKVSKVMHFLEWTWYDSTTETKVPSMGELVLKAQYLLEDAMNKLLCADHKEYITSTGGFHVQGFRCDDSGYIVLELKFVVAEWDNRE